MPDRITRRDFIKLGALATAGVAVSGCTINLQRKQYLESYVQPPEEELPGENTWFATTCRQCSAGCGVIVRTNEGYAHKVEGNPLHPVSQGKLCARGQAILQELYDPDRLQSAVQQTGGRGSGVFTPLYWEEALAILQDRLSKAPAGSVAFFGGNVTTHAADVVGRFMQAIGGRAPVFYSLADELEGTVAMRLASQQALGAAALPYWDLGNADAVFSFGAHLFDGGPSMLLYSRAYTQLRRRPVGKRGYLAHLEARFSAAAGSADEWVPVRPGTEGLVALALGRLLSDQGIGSMASTYAQVDLNALSSASGVPLDQLNRLAGILARAASPLAIPGDSLAAQQNGPQGLAAVLALNRLLGRMGQPGGVFLPPDMSVQGTKGLAPAPHSSFADVHGLIDDMAAGRVQVLLLYGIDPVFALPASSGFAEALAQVPWVVSFNSAVDDTAYQADLLLPDHTNLESWGYQIPSLADRTVVSSLQPVVQPLYSTRSTVDVFLAAAQGLGGNAAQALPWGNEVDYLKGALGELGSDDAFWRGFRAQGGYWTGQAELRPPQGSAPSGVLDVPLPTLAGNEADYPLVLYLFPSTVYDGRGANKPWLQELPDPTTTVAWQTWVELAPSTAGQLGVRDGDVVRVVSSAGEVEAIVYLYPGLDERAAAMPVGRGHAHYGRFAGGYGSNPLHLLAPIVVPENNSLAWGATRVRIERTGRRKGLARLESPEGVNYLNTEEYPRGRGQ